MAKRKCKKCGRRFETDGTGDGFYSQLCRMTGFFIGGGGDTSKPGSARKAPAQEAKFSPSPKKCGEKFERVLLMFDKPPSERWEIAKNFTEEERAYAKRIARRKMMEEVRFTREWEWNGGDEEDVPQEEVDAALGESDDGSL